MDLASSADLPKLATLAVPALVALWADLGVPGEPPHFKQALVRGIAWHIQAREGGDVDAHTRRRLRQAVRAAPLPRLVEDAKRPGKKRTAISLRTGTTLVRAWGGRNHEVAVLDGGRRFRYLDREYASLSEVAREITGTRWSGPRFFGLVKLKAPR
jgi:hypothetical protein